MSDITNETDRLRRVAERKAQAARIADKRRKAQILREIVADLDRVIGRPHEDRPTAGVAVLVGDAIVAGEIAHTKVVD